MKKYFWIVAIFAILASMIAAFGYINQEKLVDRYVRKQSEYSEFHEELLRDSGSFKLITVGTASPIPGPRTQSCNIIIANGRLFIFDTGANAVRQMEKLRIPFNRIEGVYITHWHSDHFIDLPQLINRSWLLGREQVLNVYGPPPVDTIIDNMNKMLKTEQHYKIMRHSGQLTDIESSMAAAHIINTSKSGVEIVYDEAGIRITAFEVDHKPVETSLGFKIEYRGKSIVLSGDTRKSERLVEMARGADILVHDALDQDLMLRAAKVQESNGDFRSSQMIHNLINYHASTTDAAEVAREAAVKKLILSHLCPSPENPISRRFFKYGLWDIYDGPILLAEDGDLFIVN